LLTAADQAILDYAAASELVIFSAGTDFGRAGHLVRGSSSVGRRARIASPLNSKPPAEAILPAVAGELGTGALVTIAPGRVRIRSLPIVAAE